MRENYIRQHYVPQYHLQQFSIGESNQVWCFDKSEDKKFQVTPSSVAVEKYFYDGPTEDPETERWLTNLENKINGENGPYQKVVSNKEFSSEVLTPREIYYFAVYLIVQELRTRMWRDQIEDTARHLEEFVGEKATQQLQDEIEEFHQESTIRKFQSEFIKEHSAEGAEYLVNRMAWNVLENKTEDNIWTSDNPVVRHNTRAYTGNQTGGKGLASMGVELYFPLNSDLMLHLLDKKEYDLELKLMPDTIRDPEIIKFFKDIQVRESTRHIFSRSDDFSLARKRIKDTPEVGDPDRDLIGTVDEPKSLYRKWDDSYL